METQTIPVKDSKPDTSDSPFALEVMLRSTRKDSQDYRDSLLRWLPVIVVGEELA